MFNRLKKCLNTIKNQLVKQRSNQAALLTLRFDPLKNPDKLQQQQQKMVSTGYTDENAKLNLALMQSIKQPFPLGEANIFTQEILAFDFETTGLDPDKDQILSIGFVCIKQGIVCLSSGVHDYILNSSNQINYHHTQNIHQILSKQTQNGISLDDAMIQLFNQMEGRLLLCHCSEVEAGFIKAYLARKNQYMPKWLWLDTLAIEKNRSYQTHQDDFRLARLREKYKLPAYPAHHALADAIATAELFIAQIKHIHLSPKIPVKEVYLGQPQIDP